MRGDTAVVLTGIAKHFGLDVSRIGRPDLFEAAITTALAMMPAVSVVDEVVALGELRGVRQPWGVVLARLRQLPARWAARREVLDEAAEAARWRLVDRAAKRGETLRSLVKRGDLRLDEAAEQLGADFQGDSDLFDIAHAALTGGST